MSDLIEAMARAIAKRRTSQVVQHFHRDDATAALAALRETHHLVPKDQEPVGWMYALIEPMPLHKPYLIYQQRVNTDPTVVTERPLYALEKRHD